MRVNTYANRGMTLERLIELTNNQYNRDQVAIIQKVPTPVKVIKTLPYGQVKGHWEKKSTVDFIGCYRGEYICFDAKESDKVSFPLANIENHQLEHMKSVTAHGGIAFLIIYMRAHDKYFRLDYKALEHFISTSERKSIPLTYLEEKATAIETDHNGYVINYLEAERRN